MGKKKSDIYSCFEILPMKNKANKSIFMCKFCDRQYLQNATKMESHIVTQCQKVPSGIRIAYAKVQPGSTQEYNNNVSSRPSPSLSSDNSSVESRPETPVRGGGGGTSLVIKRGAGGHLTSDIVNRTPNKKPRVENNNVITLNVNALRNAIAQNNNNINNLNLTKYVQQLQQQQKKNGAGGGAGKGITINPRHMVPTGNKGSSGRISSIGSGSRGSSSVGAGTSILKSGGRVNLAATSVSAVPIGVDYFAKTFNHKELLEVWGLLARAVYSTGCPVSLFENEHWKAAFKKIRPGLTLPTTDAVSSSLLKGEYSALKKKLHNIFEPLNFVTVHFCQEEDVDGVYLSFFVVTPNSPLLYRVVKLGPGEVVDIGKISSTLDAIDQRRVLAFVSNCSIEDDPSKQWELLRSLYPGLITYGCISQGLSSLLEGILLNEKIQEFCLLSKSIVDATKSNAELKRRFQEVQRQLKLAPVPAFKFSTRCQPWASSLVKCVALLVSQREAFEILINESKEELSSVTGDSDITSSNFWCSLSSMTNILVPLLTWIKRVESVEHSSVSNVPVIFHELKAAFVANFDNLLVLDESEKESLKKKLNVVKKMCMNELHLAACLLNPKHKADGVLSSDEEEEGLEFIQFFCETREIHAASALPLLNDYRNKLEEFEHTSTWELASTVDPISWWDTQFPTSPLAEVATFLLQISATLCTTSVLQSYDPKPLFQLSVPSGEDSMEKLALVRYHLQKKSTAQKMKLMQVEIQEKIPNGTQILQVNGTEADNDTDLHENVLKKEILENGFSPEVVHLEQDFRIEDQEPMDVTQFMRQKTETLEDGFEDDEEEEIACVSTIDYDGAPATPATPAPPTDNGNISDPEEEEMGQSFEFTEPVLKVEQMEEEDVDEAATLQVSPNATVTESTAEESNNNNSMSYNTHLPKISSIVASGVVGMKLKQENEDDDSSSTSSSSSSSSSSSGSSSSSSSSKTSENEQK